MHHYFELSISKISKYLLFVMLYKLFILKHIHTRELKKSTKLWEKINSPSNNNDSIVQRSILKKEQLIQWSNCYSTAPSAMHVASDYQTYNIREQLAQVFVPCLKMLFYKYIHVYCIMYISRSLFDCKTFANEAFIDDPLLYDPLLLR